MCFFFCYLNYFVTDSFAIGRVDFGKVQELAVQGHGPERRLERFAVQKVQYEIDAVGLGDHFQVDVEIVVGVYDYSRPRKLERRMAFA